jgi:putative ABC transport system permease protein
VNVRESRTADTQRRGGAALLAEIRLAWRLAVRTPGVSALVVTLIALGVGFVTWLAVYYLSLSVDVQLPTGFAAFYELLTNVYALYYVLLPVGLVALVVILLTGSALMVSTRQQRRLHAVVSSVGAGRASLARVTLIQAAALGLVGGVVGIAGGTVAAALALRASFADVDDMYAEPGEAPPGVNVHWGVLAALLLFALVVALIAAVVPARAAATADSITALTDRGELASPTRRRAAALVLGLTGLALTAVSVAITYSDTVFSYTASSEELVSSRTLWIDSVLVNGGRIIGPLLMIIGFLLGAGTVLQGIASALGRLDPAARVAGRSAAASPRRVAPAIVVVTGTVFVAIVASATVLASDRSTAPSFPWYAAEDSVVVDLSQSGEGRRLLPDARAVVEAAEPEKIVVVERPVQSMESPEDEPDFPVVAVAHDTAQSPSDLGVLVDVLGLAVVSVDDIDALFVEPVPQEVHDTLRAGGVAMPAAGQEQGITRAAIVQTTLAESFDLFAAYLDEEDDTLDLTEVPVVEFAAASAYRALITPETASALGIETEPMVVIGTHITATAVSLDEVHSGGAAYGSSSTFIQEREDTTSGAQAEIYLPAALLVIAATAISLGLSRYERRRDNETLLAVGAPKSLLRRVSAWEALIVTGTGAAAGAFFGVVISLLLDVRAAGLPLDVIPWSWIAVMVFGLPLAMAALAWLIPPARSGPVRRTAIA